MSRYLRSYPPTIRTRARQLRQQGLTHTEICQRIGVVPQATLSYWLKGIQLNGQHKARIRAKILASAAEGRPLARLAWQRKIAAWQLGIEHRVSSFRGLADRNPLVGKVACGLLYVCEGGRYPGSRHMTFANSNPAMIEAFLRLLRRHFIVDESKFRVRIMCRWDQDGAKLVRFWSRLTGIPVQQFQRTYRDKRTRAQPTRKREYKGVCALQYLSTDLQYELQVLGEAVLQATEMVEQTGIEPVASWMPSRRSPS